MDNVTGIILAGGRSARMGADKAFLKFAKHTMIEEALRRLKSSFKELIIVANDLQKFTFLKARVIPDLIAGCGPLGGIYTGLVASGTFYNFVVACDMPFLDRKLPDYLLNKIKGYDIAVAKYDERFQPLCACYSKNCIEPIKEHLDKGNLKIRDLFERVKVNVIDETEISRLKLDTRAFVNINTPEDIASFQK